MPAPAADPAFLPTTDLRALNHVNLMVDTFIANAPLEDLRATVRALLATTPPSTALAFTRAARTRLAGPHAAARPRTLPVFLPTPPSPTSPSHPPSPLPLHPGPGLPAALAHARTLYGAGLGLAGLAALTALVRATLGRCWDPAGPACDALALLDAELCQAVQSAREEVEQGRAGERGIGAVADLRDALGECARDVRKWGGEFPFESAAATVEVWKL